MPHQSNVEENSPPALSISIITATYNAGSQLPGLIASLRAQTDKDFEWVIADGASSDDTLAILAEIEDLNIVILSQPDFGIYDALNRAIKASHGEYYVVAGADDKFSPDAVAQYKAAAIQSGADLITATVLLNGKPMAVRENQAWRYGINGFVSAHSVGTLIKRALHDKFGFYSRKLPIAADYLLISQACRNGASRFVASFIAGTFNVGGVSTTDRLGAQLELYRVQIMIGENRFIQTLLLCIWLIRFCFKASA